MGTELLKIGEVSTLLSEPVSVIRNWLRDFRTYIPVQKDEKSGYNLYDQSAVDVLRTIQRLHREQKFSMKQIELYFASGGEFSLSPVADPHDADIKELKDMMARQMDFNRELLALLEKQQAMIEGNINQRDTQLMEVLRELREQKQIAAATEAPRGWLRRLFGK